jgi:hypothetical protein
MCSWLSLIHPFPPDFCTLYPFPAVDISHMRAMTCVPTQRGWITLGFTVMPFCIFIAFLLVLHLGSYCVYTPSETYRNVRVIRPCFVLFKSLYCQGTPHIRIEPCLCICTSVGNRFRSEGCLERTGTHRGADISIGPEPIADISIIDISHHALRKRRHLIDISTYMLLPTLTRVLKFKEPNEKSYSHNVSSSRPDNEVSDRLRDPNPTRIFSSTSGLPGLQD